MDMQKPGPWGRSSSVNPGPGAAVECKTLGGCWCLELTDALFSVISLWCFYRVHQFVFYWQTSIGCLKIKKTLITHYFKDVQGWQFLTMKAAETLCMVCLPPEAHIS